MGGSVSSTRLMGHKKPNLLQSHRFEPWFTNYAVLPAVLPAILGKVSDIPVDVEPIFL
jgi:hypothetical protein